MFDLSRKCSVQLLLQCPHPVGDFVMFLSRPTLPIGGEGSAWCQAKLCVCSGTVLWCDGTVRFVLVM